LTLAQAIEHSPAQLKMLMRAVNRTKAVDGLLLCDIVYASAAAVMSKEGGDFLKNIRNQLRKQQDGE